VNTDLPPGEPFPNEPLLILAFSVLLFVAYWTWTYNFFRFMIRNFLQRVTSKHIQLMRMNYVPKHFRDHSDSEYVSYLALTVREPSVSVTNKFAHSLTHSQTFSFIH